MHLYKVGDLYHPNRRQWPEAVEYNYRGDSHELRLFLHGLRREEVDAVDRGECEFALAEPEPGMVFFLYRFGFPPLLKRTGDAIPWSDAPYQWWLNRADERTLPLRAEEMEARHRMLLDVFLVDAGTGVLRAMRAVSLTPDLTRALHTAIRAQAAQPMPPDYDARLARLYARYSTPGALLKIALARGKGGAD